MHKHTQLVDSVLGSGQGYDKNAEQAGNGLVNRLEGTPWKWFFAIETHYIAAERNKTCNSSLKLTTEHVLKPPFNFTKYQSANVSTYHGIGNYAYI